MCPLPWLEEAEDVQYNFDGVFIPLRTIDIDIQQKYGNLSRSSDKRHRRRKTSDLSNQSNNGDQAEPLDSSDAEDQNSELSGSSGEIGFHDQTRYAHKIQNNTM